MRAQTAPSSTDAAMVGCGQSASRFARALQRYDADRVGEPFATPRFFEDGYCAEAFGMTREAIAGALPGWRSTGFQLSRLVHLEVWGRLFARGESPDQVSAWLASF